MNELKTIEKKYLFIKENRLEQNLIQLFHQQEELKSVIHQLNQSRYKM